MKTSKLESTLTKNKQSREYIGGKKSKLESTLAENKEARGYIG